MSTVEEGPTPARRTRAATSAATRAPGLVVAVLAASCAIVTMTQTLVVPMVPLLPAVFDTDAGTVSWVSTATLLAGAVANPLVGRVADLYGKRRVALWLLGAFSIGSLLAAVSGSLAVIIVGRCLQGLALPIVPISVSIVRDVLPPARVARGIALISAMLGIGAGLGLPIASLLTHWFDWQVVFWVSLAVGVAAFVGIVVLVPEAPVYASGGFDALGGAWLAVVLAGYLVPLSMLARWGWSSPQTIGLFAASTVGAWGWVRHTRRVDAPVVDLSSMTTRPVVLANLVGVTLGFAWFANLYGTAARLQVPDEVPGGFGASLATVGLVMLPGSFAMMGGARACAWLSQRWSSDLALLVGTSVVAGGYLGRTLFDQNLWQVALGVVVVSGGMGAAYGALPAIVMANVDRDRTASANSVNALARAGGSALASSVDAAVVATWTVTVAGAVHPTSTALRVLFGLATASALAAAALASLIPRRSATSV